MNEDRLISSHLSECTLPSLVDYGFACCKLGYKQASSRGESSELRGVGAVDGPAGAVRDRHRVTAKS